MEIIKMLLQSAKSIIANPYIVILLSLCVLVKIMYPKLRGYMGEFWVRQELNLLPKDQYTILNNIMIEQNNDTHQIDHIVVSKFGIFVIETKNYYGLILGDEYKNRWVQYVGKKNRFFQNPIHQNYGHIKALEGLLNFNEDSFVPIVCFSNQAKLKIKANKNKVVKLSDLVACIKKYDSPLIESDIEIITEKIIKANITDSGERRNHIKNIKKKHTK